MPTLYLLPAAVVVFSAICIVLTFSVGNRLSASSGESPDPELRRARHLVWIALGLGLATLLLDLLAYGMVSGTNSDMAGGFLYAGVPTLVVGAVVLAFGFFKGRRSVAGAASAAFGVLVPGAVFVALIPWIWWSVYTGW